MRLPINPMQFSIPTFYPITDVALSGLRHQDQVELFAAGGATLVQLRDKTSTPSEFYEAAVESIRLGRRLGVRVIINDRLDIAIASGADGVHLGQDDIPPQLARSLLGPERIIGFSTHSGEQALAADLLALDYIAVGPIFGTSTKDKADPVVGIDRLSEIRQAVTKPLVAIGGITLATAQSVMRAGADSVAVISDLFVSENVPERVRAFIEATG